MKSIRPIIGKQNVLGPQGRLQSISWKKDVLNLVLNDRLFIQSMLIIDYGEVAHGAYELTG